VKAAADCVFALPALPTGLSSPPRMAVRADGVTVPRDAGHVAGWDYTDSSWSFIRLFGPVCADFLAGQIKTVSILFFCGDSG
jgi:hypothetical protein